MGGEEPSSKKLKISHIVSPGDDGTRFVCAPRESETHSHGHPDAQTSPPTNHTNIMSSVHDIIRSPTGKNDVAAETTAEPDTAQSSESNVQQQLRDVDVSGDPASAVQPTISKNQLKKLKRRQDWEDKSQYRKTKRKQKTAEKKERKRAARAEASVTSMPAISTTTSENNTANRSMRPTQVPITILLDCQYDEYMLEKERISLGSQLTRCYSDNRSAPFKAHMVVSSFHGPLKERFETVLSNTHRLWKGVKFSEDDCVVAAEEAQKAMQAEGSGAMGGALVPSDDQTPKSDTQLREEGEIVYLSSDSPHTLTELRPYSTYIIGGLVDRNRAKGLCYQKAMADGIRTAKLPISEYIQMASRSVLATNHVFEIMLKWLALGNWAEAFLLVIPKRKGGILRHTGEDNFDEVMEDGGTSAIAADEVAQQAEDDDDTAGYASDEGHDVGVGNGDSNHTSAGEDYIVKEAYTEGGNTELDEL
ncbi:MAG: tRNA (guanine(9)-N(1))-methyltransferase [Candelina submexicana]|nr:MAG: tRNA (guanine(9)-N(1))-methyltransferase [Candelina submexicana]